LSASAVPHFRITSAIRSSPEISPAVDDHTPKTLKKTQISQ
jgi:hypothetical protein